MFLTKKHKQKILQARERVVFEPLPASAAERRPIRDRKIVLQLSTHFSRIFLGNRKTKLLFCQETSAPFGQEFPLFPLV